MDQFAVEIEKEIHHMLKQKDSSIDWPAVKKNRSVSKSDFAMVMGSLTGKLKDISLPEFSTMAAQHIQSLASNHPMISGATAQAGYINITVHRPQIFAFLKDVLEAGDSYGKSNVMAGKKVIVEHTSSNPNGPLHVGNLRNVILGGILSKLLESVGYSVKQHFYVNDLGAQIGLTALGFTAVNGKLKINLKVDQWIGIIYAIMNTFSELQVLGQNLGDLNLQLENGEDPISLKYGPTEKHLNLGKEIQDEIFKLKEYVEIFQDLQPRQPELFALILKSVKDVNIKQEAGELNLRYEKNEPQAVKIFREMVIACLSGVKETLDTYDIHHDSFDFESELGWEGSNDRVLEVMKNSKYFVPPTQKNAEGKKEGGYFNLDQFIKDNGLPQGKRGYQPDYPPLYILRPDYSTLYTFRDIVYSMKKMGNADMVLNVIASEQNIAQEKVQLGVSLLQHEKTRKQFHMSYELVKLLRDGKEVKMSGRRGRYELADDLYMDLKKEIGSMMKQKMEGKSTSHSEEEVEEIIHQVSTAAMKYALVSISCKSKINFNVQKVCSFEDSSAPFLLYNSTRIFSLFRKHEDGIKTGNYPQLPPITQVDWKLLTEQNEWELLMDYVLAFPNLVKLIACPQIPESPALPEFPIHLLCDFLISLVRLFSKYWSSCRILKENPTKEEAETMAARLYLCKAVHLVLKNGLKMLTITPLERM